MAHLKCRAGDVIFVRAVVLEAASDCFQVRFDDGGYYVLTTWVPAGECAKAEDIGELRPIRGGSQGTGR